MTNDQAISTDEAGRLIGVTTSTIRTLIARGDLVASPSTWGSRFKWQVSRNSVDKYVATHGRREDHGARTRARIDAVERAVEALAGAVSGTARDEPGAVAERDDLRARVVALEESLARTREAADLQLAADKERSDVIRLLVEAVQAADRADELRRRTILSLGEALAGYEQPGHAGQLR